MTKKSSSSTPLVPNSAKGLERFKLETANEVGVTLKQGYNGDITAAEAGKIGGNMVKKMVEAYERGLSNE